MEKKLIEMLGSKMKLLFDRQEVRNEKRATQLLKHEEARATALLAELMLFRKKWEGTDNKDILKGIDKLVKAVVSQELSVNVEAPIVNVPQPKVIKEGKEAKELVVQMKALQKLFVKLIEESQTTYITNSTPDQAVPVVLTTASRKKFYNAIYDAVIDASGNGVTKIVDEDGNLINETNPLPVSSIVNNRIIWDTHMDFDKGTKTGVEVVGTGEDAKIQLINSQNDDDVPYDDVNNYTYSDGAKITVDEGGSNAAKLKIQSGGDTMFNFTTPANYDYNAADIEVADDEARLYTDINDDTTCYATYTNDIDLNFGLGTLTGTAVGGASVVSNRLDLTGGNKCVHYDLEDNAENLEYTGAIKMKFTPNFTGSPAANNQLIALSSVPYGSAGSIPNYTTMWINTSGNLGVQIRDNANNIIFSGFLGSFGAVSGVAVEVELNMDLTAGETRVFLDGVQLGSTITDTSVNRSMGTGSIVVGASTVEVNFADAYIEDVMIFDEVQHTANYTPGYTLPEQKYNTDDPAISNSNAYAFTSALSTFTETATKTGGDIRYQVSSDDGVTWEYWDGAMWKTITAAQTDTWYFDNEANDAATVDANISALAATGDFKFRAYLRSNNSTQTPMLDSIYIAETNAYPLDDDLYVDTANASQIAPATIYSWLTALADVDLPAGTDARLLFSVDGRTTWLTWDGVKWDEPASDTTRTQAATISEAQDNFASLDLGSGTLDVRLFLYTTDSSETPSFNNLNVVSDGGYNTSGDFETDEYDSTYLSLDWQGISWAVDIPAGTTASFFVRAGNDSGDLGDYGPALTNNQQLDVTGRYIQWKMELTSTGENTPQLDGLGIGFSTPFTQFIRP